MITDRHIDRIVSVIMTAALVICFLAIGYGRGLAQAAGDTGVTMEYESKLFDTSRIMTVDIRMDQDDWDDMLANATAEEYKSCDVVINGTTFKNVAIRPKGNTSLTSIASDPDNDRYSFKLEFDHYDEGQTCWGLDKLILNNNFADATNMKEAVVYDMFQYLGADASLYNYAKISVNGEYWGVYLALEGVEDSFLLRNYGTQKGQLYKPDSMNMASAADDDSEDSFSAAAPGGGQGFPGGGADASLPQAPDDNFPDSGNFDMNNMPDAPGGGGAGGFGSIFSSGGADLSYSDDDLDSYSTIWDGAVTNSTDQDHKRVVKALKNISEGNDLEEYMDVDNILRYMAVHSFVVNEDSFTGSMNHNYYLYEYDGKLNIIPWDYNLSFGGMGMNNGDASSVINDPIDTPFQSTSFFDGLLENEEYLEKYHEYYRQLVEKYVQGGEFEKTYERIRSQIDDLVRTDPNAMYTYDEYETAAATLVKVISLRAASAEGQLNGTIPSTDAGQRADSSALIDGGDLDLSVMGTFGGGGFDSSMFQTGGSEEADSLPADQAADTVSLAGTETAADEESQEKRTRGQTVEEAQEDIEDTTENATEAETETGSAGQPDGMPSGSGAPGAPGDFDASSMPDGFDPSNMPDDFDASNVPDGFEPSGGQPSQAGTPPAGEIETEGVSEAGTEEEALTEAAEEPSSDGSASDASGRPSFPGGNFSASGNFPDFNGSAQTQEDTTVQDNIRLYLILLGITVAAIIVAAVYPKRKK